LDVHTRRLGDTEAEKKLHPLYMIFLKLGTENSKGYDPVKFGRRRGYSETIAPQVLEKCGDIR
jgi:hypothetical protein